MISLAENPPARFVSNRTAEVEGEEWWVAHTKSRCEKAFAWELVRREIDYFLPLIKGITHTGGRRRHVMKPLLPSYVFFRGDAERRYQALETGRLCQVLPVKDQRELSDELDALERALASGQFMDAYPSMAVGRRCRVAAGQLQGIAGIVVERTRTAKVVLQVTMLGRGAMLEIDPALLEMVD